MLMVEELDKVTQEMRSEVVRMAAEIEALKGREYEAYKVVEETEKDRKVTVRARLLLESYSEIEQTMLRTKVEGLVTAGLQGIFGPEYYFTVETKMLRGQAAMEFVVAKRDLVHDPMDSHGGGLVNVVALVLRLVIVALTPGLSRVVVLDEPFAQLSQGYIEPVSQFIRALVDRTGIQLLIVSHEPEIADVADAAYRLFSESGVTMIEKGG